MVEQAGSAKNIAFGVFGTGSGLHFRPQRLMAFSAAKPWAFKGYVDQTRGGPRSVSGGPTDETTIITRDGDDNVDVASIGTEISVVGKLAKCARTKLRSAHCSGGILSSSPDCLPASI